jgi:ElaA protein
MGHADLSLLDWRWRAFADLGVRELHNIHRARQSVFMLEQQCLYADADAFDEQAHHLAAWTPAHPLPLAYARVLAPGVKYAEPAIGRVLTSAIARRHGLGREVMTRALSNAARLYAGHKVRLSAQSRLIGFYGSLGFVPVGEPYLEDDIPHIEMLLRMPL